MAKGGRYLNTNKKSKKGKSWKILMIILLVFALLIGGIVYFVKDLIGSRKDFGEVTEQNQEMSYDDLIAELYGSMDSGNPVDESQENTEASNVETPQASE